jgi:putative endonuclease
MTTVPAVWQVYMILCSDASLYTGITNDLERRLARHAAGQGAKFFKGRAPGPVVYLETGHTRSSASRREAAIKKLRRDEKLRLIASAANAMDARRD